MNPLRLVHLVLGALACGGCVLPMPTTKVEVPSVHGRVVRAGSGDPIDLAAVMVDGHKTTAVMSGRDGTFVTDQITRSSLFRVWNPFAGDSVESIKLRVIRPGFAKETRKLDWHRNTERQIHLAQPIELRPKTADESARDLLERAF
jgi:hypothetical protein